MAMARQHSRTLSARLDDPTPGQPEAFIQAGHRLVDETGSLGAGGRLLL